MAAVAELLTQSANEVSFRVDEVQHSGFQYETMPLHDIWGSGSRNPLLAVSHDQHASLIMYGGPDPLSSAVLLAFRQHLPLRLTPDMIWMVLAQGFAHHLVNHSEALRSLLVDHKGVKALKVDTLDDPTSPDFDWPGVINQWSALIEKHSRPEIVDLVVCDFSTTTPEIRTASQVVLMHAVREYFTYELGMICGIPWITLEGTAGDWEKIRDRVARMSEYYLDWWTDRLLPICDELIKTALGSPSIKFWQHVYVPREVYGGDLITGWLADLYPYLENGKTRAPELRNPILSKPRKNWRAKDGISSLGIPSGVSTAPLTVHPPVGESFPMELLGGFLGVEQKPDSGIINSVLGWAVRRPERAKY